MGLIKFTVKKMEAGSQEINCIMTVFPVNLQSVPVILRVLTIFKNNSTVKIPGDTRNKL